MNKFRARPINLTQALAACALVAASLPAAAADWNLDALCTSTNNLVPNTTGNCGSSLTVSGWSTNTGSPTSTTSDNFFHTASVYDWGNNGLGVVGSGENKDDTGPHAVDNAYGTDAILFTFTVPTNLTAVKIGWNGTDNATTTGSIQYRDSDLTVLAWTGQGVPTLNGVTPNSAGWTIIGNYANVGAMTDNTTAVSTTTYSSYWLVSAYNSTYFGSGPTFGTIESNNYKIDAFKVLQVSGVAQVPEPTSMALFGIAALAIAATRRRQKV